MNKTPPTLSSTQKGLVLIKTTINLNGLLAKLGNVQYIWLRNVGGTLKGCSRGTLS